MSAIRYASPYHPTRLVDLGPQHGRVAGFGGRMVVPIAIQRVKGQRVNIPSNAELARERRRKTEHTAKIPDAERCGVIMLVLGVPCARRRGHKNDHRSAYCMRNAKSMRSGRGML